MIQHTPKPEKPILYKIGGIIFSLSSIFGIFYLIWAKDYSDFIGKCITTGMIGGILLMPISGAINDKL